MIRSDFVSNSSSSNFIVSMKGKDINKHIEDVYNVFKDSEELIRDKFKYKTLLTVAEIYFIRPNPVKKNEYVKVFIPSGITINDDEVSNYMRDDGTFKDISIEDIYKLTWEHIDDEGNVCENDDIVYSRRNMGKVTKFSIAFTRYLYNKIKKLQPDTCIFENDVHGAHNIINYLIDMEGRLLEGDSLYAIKTTYEGDGMSNDSIWVEDARKDDNGFKRLRKVAEPILGLS